MQKIIFRMLTKPKNIIAGKISNQNSCTRW